MIPVPLNNCPYCNAIIDAATSVSTPEQAPSPGDISVCFKCSAYLVYNDDMKSENLSEQEFKKLPADLQNNLIKYKMMIRAYHQK